MRIDLGFRQLGPRLKGPKEHVIERPKFVKALGVLGLPLDIFDLGLRCS